MRKASIVGGERGRAEEGSENMSSELPITHSTWFIFYEYLRILLFTTIYGRVTLKLNNYEVFAQATACNEKSK